METREIFLLGPPGIDTASIHLLVEEVLQQVVQLSAFEVIYTEVDAKVDILSGCDHL